MGKHWPSPWGPADRVLAMQIDTHACSRAGAAITNFDERLPPRRCDLAREALNDPSRRRRLPPQT